VSGFIGDGGPATSAELSTTYGIALDTCGNLYVADKDNERIRKVSLNPNCWSERLNNIVTQHISVYPNPVFDELCINNIATQSTYNLRNLVGVIMQQGALKEGNNSITVPSLSTGMYMLEMVDEEGNKTIKKIVKE
jgi:hypothetical protein